MKRHSLPCCLLDASAILERDCVIAEINRLNVKKKKKSALGVILDFKILYLFLFMHLKRKMLLKILNINLKTQLQI